MEHQNTQHTNGTLIWQLTETMTANIRRGVWRDGMKLPGERQLAQEFSVCRSTVVEALKQLAQTGLIEKIPAKGSFVTGVPVPRRIVLIYPEASFGFRPQIDTMEHLFIFQLLQSGIMTEAAKHNVQITLFCCEAKQAETALPQLMGFDGFIFVNGQLAALQKKLAAHRVLTQIRTEVFPEIPGARVVSYDRFPGYRELLELVQKNHISRAVILSSRRTEWLDLRASEFSAVAREKGMAVEYIVTDAGNFRELLRKNSGSFVFLNQADDWEALYQASREEKLVPGRDFLTAAQGSGMTLGGAVPPLAYLRSPYFEMGREALLLAQCPQGAPPEAKLFRSQLILSETLCPRKSRGVLK